MQPRKSILPLRIIPPLLRMHRVLYSLFGVDWLQNPFYICVTEFVSVKFSKVTRICIHINKKNDYKLLVFVAFTALTVLYSTGPTVKTVWLKQRKYLHEMQLSRSLTIWLRKLLITI